MASGVALSVKMSKLLPSEGGEKMEMFYVIDFLKEKLSFNEELLYSSQPTYGQKYTDTYHRGDDTRGREMTRARSFTRLGNEEDIRNAAHTLFR